MSGLMGLGAAIILLVFLALALVIVLIVAKLWTLSLQSRQAARRSPRPPRTAGVPKGIDCAVKAELAKHRLESRVVVHSDIPRA
jgi:uncharacterized protein (DUF58 family)